MKQNLTLNQENYSKTMNPSRIILQMAVPIDISFLRDNLFKSYSDTVMIPFMLGWIEQ